MLDLYVVSMPRGIAVLQPDADHITKTGCVCCPERMTLIYLAMSIFLE